MSVQNGRITLLEAASKLEVPVSALVILWAKKGIEVSEDSFLSSSVFSNLKAFIVPIRKKYMDAEKVEDLLGKARYHRLTTRRKIKAYRVLGMRMFEREEIHKAAKKRQTGKRLYLKRGEKTLGQLSTLCFVSKTTGEEWRSKGYIHCVRRGFWWVILRRDYLGFLEAAANYKIPVQKRVSERCQKLLEKELKSSSDLGKVFEAMGSEALSASDFSFAHYHRQNGCTLNELAHQLKDDTTYSKLRQAVIMGRIITEEGPNGSYLIPLAEIIRVIVLVREWIVTCDAAELCNKPRGTILAYAKEGELGETRVYITGGLAIRKTVCADLLERCEELRQKNYKLRNDASKYLSEDEYSPRTFGEKIGATDSAVKYFEKEKKFIRSELRNGKRVYLHSELVRFAKEVTSGKIAIRSIKIRKRCKEIAETA